MSINTVNELKNERDRILVDLKKLQLKNSGHKVKMAKYMDKEQHAIYLKTYQKNKEIISEGEIKLREINKLLRENGCFITGRSGQEENRRQFLEKRNTRNKLAMKMFNDLREEYSLFSSDMTRVSSMRLMAAEFSNKIEEIFKISKGE